MGEPKSSLSLEEQRTRTLEEVSARLGWLMVEIGILVAAVIVSMLVTSR